MRKNKINPIYGYRIIDAIMKQDKSKIHGKLGVNTKLDCKETRIKSEFKDAPFEINNPIDLAIWKLDEADLIKLIQSNTKLNLEESIASILIKLDEVDKDTDAVIDALISKLPQNSRYIELLEEYKAEAHADDDQEDTEKTALSEWLLTEFVQQKNDYLNACISLYSDHDVQHKHYYIIENNGRLSIEYNDTVLVQYEKSIEA